MCSQLSTMAKLKPEALLMKLGAAQSIFILFSLTVLHVTFGHRVKHLVPGLSTRSVLEKFSAVQMIDVHVPTSDGRELTLTRYTQPEPELKQPKMILPLQPVALPLESAKSG
jgi:hypothetical protein